jgi:hypothetical protein
MNPFEPPQNSPPKAPKPFHLKGTVLGSGNIAENPFADPIRLPLDQSKVIQSDTLNSTVTESPRDSSPVISTLSLHPYQNTLGSDLKIQQIDVGCSNPFKTKISSGSDSLDTEDLFVNSMSHLEISSNPSIMNSNVDLNWKQRRTISQPIMSLQDPFQDPPSLPPRPKIEEVRSASNPTFSRQNAAPPLPNRPILSDAKSSLVKAETKCDFHDVYKGAPIAEYMPNQSLFHKGPIRSFCFSGFYSITGTGNIRVWYIPNGENVKSIMLHENKVHSVEFVTSLDLEYHGKMVWAGLEKGELIQVDVETGEIIAKSSIHSAPISHIIRARNAMYTLDENGSLKIWTPDEKGRTSLHQRPRALRIQPRQQHILIHQNWLWACAGKQVDVYNLVHDSTLLQHRFDVGFGISNITSIVYIDFVYIGHECGRITKYNPVTFEKVDMIQLTPYKITSMQVVQGMIWVGLGTGKIMIVDVSTGIWDCKIEFLAHESSSVVSIVLDDTCMILQGQLTVASVSDSGQVKFWDGLLTQYKVDQQLHSRCNEYSTYTPMTVFILSYNIDSRKPAEIDQDDISLFENHVKNTDADIFVFGFQELIDLENVYQ